jgi:hypothetical protein
MREIRSRARLAIVAGWVVAILVAVWVVSAAPRPASTQESASPVIPGDPDGIGRVIPAGEYRVRVWAPVGTPGQPFIYVLSPKDAPAPELSERYFVTDLGVLPRDALMAQVTRAHDNVGGNVVVQAVRNRDGAVVAHVIRTRDARVTSYFDRAQHATLYLSTPESVQSGGGGGGGGGAGGM